jgi:acyl-CoA synthetase (AMP-forming)/AMP-acid ligase II
MSAFNLLDVFLAEAGPRGAREALAEGEESLSRAQLMAKAASWAAAFRRAGVEPGQSVGLALGRGLDMIPAILALWWLDATAVPIDFRSRAEERERISSVLDLALLLEERRPPGRGDYPALSLDALRAWETELPDDLRDGPRGLGHPALLTLTSGTTGLPQAVGFDHQRFLNRLRMQWQPGAVVPEGRFLTSSPLSFSATRNHIFTNLLFGGSVTLLSPLSGAEELVEELRRRAITGALFSPPPVQGLLSLKEGGGFPALQSVFLGGAPLAAEQVAEARRRICEGLIFCYSSSITGQMTMLRGGDIERKAGSVGPVLPLVRLEVTDGEGHALPPGEIGEVRARSPGIASFLRGPERAAGDRMKDGWAYPGDLGFFDAEGFLTLTGRASDVINRGGAKIYPSEVERVLTSHPLVVDAVALGLADARLGEELVAYLELREGASAALVKAELQASCRASLATDKQPRELIFLDRLPRNANGKVLRRALAERGAS